MIRLRAVSTAVLGSLIVVSALLAGCGGKPEDAATSATPAPATSAAATTGFALLSAGSEAYEGRPAALLTFSGTLAGAQKFDELLSIAGAKGEKVDGSWVLDADGKRLRFPYLEADKTYKIKLKAELSAADGKTLASASEQEIYTGPLEPLLGFASQGSVLPSHETRGLPIVSLNVKEVDIEFLRVRDKDLPKFLAEYTRNGRRSYWSLGEMAKYAESVYANRFALESKPNERTLTYVPIRDIDELKLSGLYFAVMKRPAQFESEFDTAMFFVSDIGLHLRAYPGKIEVHTASLETGEPKANVALAIRDKDGNDVLTAQTDGDGLASFDYKLNSANILVATWGRDVSVLAFNQPALDLSEFAITGRPQRAAEIFPWSGRDLYRPGETLRVAALLRDFDGKSTPAQPLFATLRQPDGRIVIQQQIAAGELGYYEFTRVIAADAPTGRWSVDFATDPAQSDSAYGFKFRVEEFLPERLKLDLASTVAVLKPAEALPLTVDAAYLYGAPAAGNRFTAKLALAVAQHPVATLPDFYFGDALAELPKAPKDLIDEALDDEGKLAQDIEVGKDATIVGPTTVVIAGSVYETGGRAVSRNLERTIWPADTLIGVRPLFTLDDGAPPSGKAQFEVIRTNPAGELLSAAGLKARLIREIRDYHWTFVRDTGWHLDFTQRYENAAELDVAFEAGKRGQLSFPVEWGSYRLEVVDPQSNLTLRLPFQAGWGFDDDNRGTEARPDKVKLALDKTSYRGGDTIKLTLTPPHEGPALLMLEGDGLLWHKTLAVRAGTEIEIPLDAGWERHDLYLTALVFRPGSSTERITPNRAVGIVHVPIAREDRKLAVELSTPDTMRPNTALKVQVKAPQFAGQTAQVRVTAVDLGVLNITRFALPDAAAWFFAQRRLGVDAYDLYSRVIESFDGNRARLRYGGDMALGALPAARRPNSEVQTVDLFHAPVALDAKGEATVELAVPDFNGTVRVRALAYSGDRYGSGERDAIVRAPVVVEASSPRIMAPGDKSQLTVDVQNLSGAAGKYHLALSATGPVALDKDSGDVALEDGKKQTLSFPLHAREAFGTAEIVAVLSGGENDITRKFHVAVRPAWAAVHRTQATVQSDSAAVAPDASLLNGLIPDSVNARISVGTLPPLPFAAAVKDLFAYPYGCVEQTTSKAYPLVWLNDETADRLGLRDVGFPDPQGNKVLLTAERRKLMLDEAFARISSMQTENGHFAMWPGDTYANTAMTPYVAELLENARDAGYAIPEPVLTKALNAINEDLMSGGANHYEYDNYEHLRLAEMAYGGYVLARVDRAPVGTLRAIFDNERESLVAPLPLVHLGAALALQGDKPRAEQAVAEAFSKEWKRPAWLGDYGSDLRDLALMVALTHEHGLAKPEYDAKIFDLARQLLGQRSSGNGYWLSTQEQIAIFRLGKDLVVDAPRTFGASVTVGGTSEELTGRAFYTREFGPAQLSAGIRFVPNAQGTIYITQDVAGIPRSAPATARDDLKIKRRWYLTDGTEWDGGTLNEGDVLVAAITIEGKQTMHNAIVIDLLAGGLEVENLNLTDSSQWENVTIEGVALSDRSSAAEISHEEYRDDRYVAAITLREGSIAHLFYLVRAVSPGDFIVPPPSIEDMYRPEVRAIGDAVPARIQVQRP